MVTVSGRALRPRSPDLFWKIYRQGAKVAEARGGEELFAIGKENEEVAFISIRNP